MSAEDSREDVEDDDNKPKQRVLPTSKGFIMDKYFGEMEKVWQAKDFIKDLPAEKLDKLREQLCAVSRQLDRNETAAGSMSTRALQVQIHPGVPVHEQTIIYCNIHNSTSPSNLTMYTQLEDMIHLTGPLTEDAIIKTLQSRFYQKKYVTSVGPILVCVNPFTNNADDSPLTSTDPCWPQLKQLIHKVWSQLLETGISQSVVLSGDSGSGKTYTSQVLVRQLFDIAGGGTDNDLFRHLTAAYTVLKSMGHTGTVNNPHSSRIGLMIESHFMDASLYRNKIHCHFTDQVRVTNLRSFEKNFHIFHQMLAGLTQEEKVKYHLEGYGVENLQYMNQGSCSAREHEQGDASRFLAWRCALSSLGISFTDIMRILSAIMLLGNVTFLEGSGIEPEVQGNSELKSVAALLGVSSVTLYKALTCRTRRVRGQVFKSMSDAFTANQSRDSLAQALYCRSVAAIVKRVNNHKRPASNLTVSTDSSNDSQHQDVRSNNNGPAPQSPATSRSSSHGYGSGLGQENIITIADMFSFQNFQANDFEELCENLCAETLQHFYNTHIFRKTEEACSDEGIQSDIEISYYDNTMIIELISSQRTGLFSLLDAESSLQQATADTYLQKLRVQHKLNKHFSEETSSTVACFCIRHTSGNVNYNADKLLHVNRSYLADDIVWAFAKHNSNFGFVSYIFAQELKILHDQGGPKGLNLRVFSRSTSSYDAIREGRSTLAGEHLSRLDCMLKALVLTHPHFVRCIKSNAACQTDTFERETVIKQVRTLQLLETVHLMTGGLPHKIRYKTFNARYRILARYRGTDTAKTVFEECKMILECFLKAMDEGNLPYISAHWALGKKHIFLSESARQQFERERDAVRSWAAIVIQKNWRRKMCIKRWPQLKRQIHIRKRERIFVRKQVRHSRSLSETRETGNLKRPDQSSLHKTCDVYGLDLDTPPPVPASRSYTVAGSVRMGYPQYRILTHNYPDLPKGQSLLCKGQEVKVIGASSQRGFLLVDHHGKTIQVPYQITQLKKTQPVQNGIHI